MTTTFDPDSTCLPSLKILHIDISKMDAEFTQKLFSSCPVLEDFSIIHSNIMTFDSRFGYCEEVKRSSES